MNNAFIALGNVFNDLIRSSSAAERVLSLIDARPDVNPDDGDLVDRETVKGAGSSSYEFITVIAIPIYDVEI